MKIFLGLLFVLIIGCVSTQVKNTELECDRMLWRPDLNKAIQMFCLGKELCSEEDTQCTKLIAEAYHPTDQGLLYTLWDNNNDCIADDNYIYKGEKGDGGKYIYTFVHLQPASVGLTEIRNSEESYGIKVLREIECLKKL